MNTPAETSPPHDSPDPVASGVVALASVLGPAQLGLPQGDELLATLSGLGRELGVRFERPPAALSSRSDTRGSASEAETLAADTPEVELPSQDEADWAAVQAAVEEVGAIAAASGVRSRPVRLVGPWWRSDCGPLLAFAWEGDSLRPVALVRRGGRYEMLDPRTHGWRPLRGPARGQLAPLAVTFYRPLPDGPVSLWRLPLLAARWYRRDLIAAAWISVLAVILALNVPIATQWVVDTAIPNADRTMLLEIALVLAAVNLGGWVFRLAEGVASLRFMTWATTSVQAAVWDRLLCLPVAFFRTFTTGDLVNRALMISQVGQALGASLVQSALTGVLMLAYVLLMLWFSWQLGLLALAAGGVLVLVVLLCARRVYLAAGDLELRRGSLLGMVVQIVLGLPKLRVAAAEGRAFGVWAQGYAGQLRGLARWQWWHDVQDVLATLVASVTGVIVYLVAASTLFPSATGGGLSLGVFIAFTTAFGAYTAGLGSLAATALEVASALAQQRLAAPLLQVEAEQNAQRPAPGVLSGRIDVSNLTFRYRPDGPAVVNDVSLHVEPGEFVAIVGPSGSGKSTLLRLLLGFEHAEAGQIRYDGKDLRGIDPVGLRRQIGTVLQSSQIIGGTLLDNIAGGHLLSPDDVLRAAQDAELADDIAKLPMGLYTVLSDGGGNLSGGQRQRVLLARALALRPPILMLDEATSALDDTTQRAITGHLVARRATRIVVAHRLSTIRDADRILVLDAGRLVQAGTFEQLLSEDGLFARLARRQRL